MDAGRIREARWDSRRLGGVSDMCGCRRTGVGGHHSTVALPPLEVRQFKNRYGEVFFIEPMAACSLGRDQKLP